MIDWFNNVIDKPETYVKIILNNGFGNFRDGHNVFKNVSLRFNDQFSKFLEKKFPEYKVDLNFVRKSPFKQEEPNYIHSDEMMGDLTAIIYLNKNHPKDYGTSFYYPNGEFETMYDADYNSVLVFNSDRLHSRNNFDNFGEGDDSRLIQVAFLKKRNNEEGRVGVF